MLRGFFSFKVQKTNKNTNKNENEPQQTCT